MNTPDMSLERFYLIVCDLRDARKAYSSLEMALKRKAGKERISLRTTLAQTFKGRHFASGVGPPIDISDAIAHLRNDLAHGNPTMYGQGIDALELCADLINELFARGKVD